MPLIQLFNQDYPIQSIFKLNYRYITSTVTICSILNSICILAIFLLNLTNLETIQGKKCSCRGQREFWCIFVLMSIFTVMFFNTCFYCILIQFRTKEHLPFSLLQRVVQVMALEGFITYALSLIHNVVQKYLQNCANTTLAYTVPQSTTLQGISTQG